MNPTSRRRNLPTGIAALRRLLRLTPLALLCYAAQPMTAFSQPAQPATQAEGQRRGAVDLQYVFPVTLNPGDQQSYNLWGELKAADGTQGKTLLVLLSGVTYDHRYWDFPGGPSFVNAAVQRGYAVLNLDRLATGYSSYPPAAALNLAQDVFTIHQVVTAVTSGSLSQFGFRRIVLVAHSYGSTISISYAANYDDVAAIVLTGITHTPGSGVGAFAADVVPVEQDPTLGYQGFPPGYLTVKAGSLGPLFFYPETPVPSIVATNESLKGVFSPNPTGALPNLFGSSQGKLGEQGVKVPVLGIFGDKDVLFGDTGTQTRLRSEPAFYPMSPRVNDYAIPNTGHSLALSSTFELTDGLIFDWVGSLFGQRR